MSVLCQFYVSSMLMQLIRLPAGTDFSQKKYGCKSNRNINFSNIKKETVKNGKRPVSIYADAFIYAGRMGAASLLNSTYHCSFCFAKYFSQASKYCSSNLAIAFLLTFLNGISISKAWKQSG